MTKLLLCLILCLCYTTSQAKDQDWSLYSNDQIANAIFKAENSVKYPYGILTKYKHTTPRQACLNTIIHARRDFKGGDFIEFLGSRYCPINCENDNSTNKYWVRNVKYFLKGGN